MGRVRNLRLPDEMEAEVDKYLVDNKIKFTDLVISGVTSIIYQESKQPEKRPVNTMPGTAIVTVIASGETVYVPDPVSPVKQPKQSASKQAQPIVNAMLSGIKARPTVAHHPTCMCAVCKPA